MPEIILQMAALAAVYAHVERICIDEAMKFSLGTSDINLKPRDGDLESCRAAK